jgi:hypothetical protein
VLTRRSYLSRSGFYKKPSEPGSRKWLIAELDKHTSIIVRRRDRRCVTCGGRRDLQCSHFYSRRYLAIRFDLRNCNCMCGRCNRRHNFDPFPYMAFMQSRHGPEVVEELSEMRASRRKVTDDELRRTLGRYQEMTPAREGGR